MLWAARIIEQHFDLVFYIRGEAATIDRWMSVLPAEVVRSRPRLLLAQAIIAATNGHFEVVEPLLEAVARAPRDWADEPFEPVGGAAASNLINVPALTTLVRSFAAQYHGDAEATAAFARQTLAEVKPGERLLSANASVFLAVAEWLLGRLTQAERAIAASVTGWRETGQLTVASWGYYSLVLIQRAQGRLDAAVRTCEQALDTLVTAGRQALAAGLGYVGLAEIASALAEALVLACPQGYVRIFANEGPPMAALLGRLIAAQRTGRAASEVPLGYLARLQRAFGPGRSSHDPVPSGLVDPLTRRELEVLGRLAEGRSNQAIAGELVVTLDTVKKHVGHVLRKLGAANRTEAVARARELDLL